MNKRLNIFLDLDETCIHSEGLAEFVQDDDNQDLMDEYDQKQMHIMGGLFIIFERPHLQEFLDYVFKNFNVSVWTAASKNYATFIIDRSIMNKKLNDKNYERQKERVLEYIFYNKHGKISKQHYKTPKQLKLLDEHFKLKYNENNTIIIDDHNDVYGSQKKNCIHIKPFEVFSETGLNDNELLAIIKQLKQINKVYKKTGKIKIN